MERNKGNCEYCGAAFLDDLPYCPACWRYPSSKAPTSSPGPSASPRLGAEEPTSEEEAAIDELSEAVAKDLDEGKSKQKIVKELVKQGAEEPEATEFVDQIEQALNEYRQSPEGRREMAGKYARHMLFGTLWVIGGMAVTLWTYNAAGPGGTYIIAWGAILFGGIDFLWGLFNWIRYSV